MTAPVMEPRPRPVDRTVSWILYVLQLLVTLALSGLAITSVFMTDSCGSTDDDAHVCDLGYFGATLFGYWGLGIALLVAVPVAIVVSTRRGRPSWRWPALALLALAASTVLFVFLMTH